MDANMKTALEEFRRHKLTPERPAIAEAIALNDHWWLWAGVEVPKAASHMDLGNGTYLDCLHGKVYPNTPPPER